MSSDLRNLAAEVADTAEHRRQQANDAARLLAAAVANGNLTRAALRVKMRPSTAHAMLANAILRYRQILDPRVDDIAHALRYRDEAGR